MLTNWRQGQTGRVRAYTRLHGSTASRNLAESASYDSLVRLALQLGLSTPIAFRRLAIP
jgi:hypothetical protein